MITTGGNQGRLRALCTIAVAAMLAAACEGGEPTFMMNDTGQAITVALAGPGSCWDTNLKMPAAPGETVILQDCSTADIELMYYDRADGSRCIVDVDDLRRKTRAAKYSPVYFWDTVDEVDLGAVRCREQAAGARE
jgi:hypothetical protein